MKQGELKHNTSRYPSLVFAYTHNNPCASGIINVPEVAFFICTGARNLLSNHFLSLEISSTLVTECFAPPSIYAWRSSQNFILSTSFI